MGRFFRTVLAVLCSGLVASASPSMASPVGSVPDRILVSHNAERVERGLHPLAWSDSLAREASDWARILAREGQLRHASQSERQSHGENLWMGTAGAYSVEVMVGAFLDERRHFRPGRFPDISRTGNWTDAGHYSQVIWPRTRHVGCAMVTARGMDFFVCRYDPGGNWIGEFVG